MRTYILAMATTALFVLPTSAFSQVDVEVGPGGVQVGPGYHRHYDDGYHRGDRYGGGRCRELRQACLHKEELGEAGMGLPQISRNVPLDQRANGHRLLYPTDQVFWN
jgi:hypothetical protein